MFLTRGRRRKIPENGILQQKKVWEMLIGIFLQGSNLEGRDCGKWGQIIYQ
jgi:hypothetical protein